MIDRENAEDVKPSGPLDSLTPEQRAEVAAALAQAEERDRTAAGPAVDGVKDVPLDVIENGPSYLFSPGATKGISALDITEIALTFVIQLVGGKIQGSGGLRSLAMRPDFYQTLSPEAQRFMVQQKE